MATKTQHIPSGEAHGYYTQHHQARRRAQAEGASFSTLANLSQLEHEAWVRYVQALKREHATGEDNFILPSRPL